MQPNTERRAGFTTPMYCPTGLTSVSIGGVEVFPDEDGRIDVPNASIHEMTQHGLSLSPTVEKAADEEAAPKKKLVFGSKKSSKK